MAATYQTSIHRSKGYTGKERAYSKGYIALITGTDAAMTFQREFQEGKADRSDPFRKSKCAWEELYALPEGLYEISEGGERFYIVVWQHAEKGAVKTSIDKERAIAIAALLDDGVSYDAARKATKR